MTIIQKKRKSNEVKVITKLNYKDEITDLIGVRVLHVFKQDAHTVGNFIKRKWDFKKGHRKPIFYFRLGDSKEYIQECKNNGCKTKEHGKGYRSIHHIIKVNTTKEEAHFAEIQVRTIFEEGWSELDHKIRYSIKKIDAKHPLDNYLSILNGIAGNADEIGKLIKINQAKIEEAKYVKDNENKPKKSGNKKNKKKKGGVPNA